MSQQTPTLFVLLVLILFSFSYTDADCVPRTSGPNDYNSISQTTAAAPTKTSSPPSPSPAPAQAASPGHANAPAPAPTSKAPSSAPTASPKAKTDSISDTTSKVVGAAVGAVATFCKKTTYADICLSAVQDLLPSSGSINATSLLTLQLQVLRSKIDAAIDKANKLLSDPSGSKLSKNIDGCIGDYKSALADYNKVVKALQSGDKGTFDSNMSAFTTYFGDCEDSFANAFASSPLTSVNEELKRITSNCLAIANVAFPGAGAGADADADY